MRAFLTLPALALVSTLPATPQNHPRRPHPATQATPPADQLPITRVALYKNGVGFFEHAGRVTGDQSVTIDFTSAQLNDVLQTLTAIDLNGGRISGAGYNSTTPLDQQLKTLPLALSADPSDVDFYSAIRGALVQVTGPALALTGRLLAIDLRTPSPLSSSRSTAEGSASPGSDSNHRFLTVVSDSGQVRTFEITSAVTVTLLDTALHTDVTRYLELLASTRNQGLRHLTLLDRAPDRAPAGSIGPRDLRVSYLSEVPVWKSTYRILFTDAQSPVASPNQTATLQGWSVVDNTTGSDWLNVHLDLIAGAPQSFIQPLSTPYYTRRPEIPLPAEAQLVPQTHESGDATGELHAPLKTPRNIDEMKENAAPQQSMMVSGASGMAGISGGSAGGVLGGVGRGYGIGAGSGGNIGGGVLALNDRAYEQSAYQSFGGQTTTAAFDDFFQYSLTDPITIRKNESALVPILQTSLPIECVTLWSARQPQALRALWITNASTLTLDRGSFSIVENGNFGGEGLLDPIHPGERRLLSYAADQAVHVTIDNAHNTRRVERLTIRHGVLTQTSTDIAEVEYLVHNAAPQPRTVIVEHPIRPGWTLDSDPKPAETTSTTDRFRVATQPRETVRLHIGERHTDRQFIRLVDRTEDQLVLLLRNGKAGPAALAQLQPVFDAHHTVVTLDQQIAGRTAEMASITTDQNRLRENLKALKGTPEEKALATRYTGELNAQEDRLAALNQQIAQLKIERTAADLDFQKKLEAIDFDQAL